MIASKPSRQGHSGAIVACYMTDETLKIVEPWTLCIHSWLSIPERSADTALYTGAARSLHGKLGIQTGSSSFHLVSMRGML